MFSYFQILIIQVFQDQNHFSTNNSKSDRKTNCQYHKSWRHYTAMDSL